MANAWTTHEVRFAPAEGLTENETEVRVLDQGISSAERVDAIDKRISDLDDTEDNAELLTIRRRLTNEVKKDPGYKFLMQVSAFSKLKLGNMISDELSRSRYAIMQDSACGEACPAPGHSSADLKWLDAPEVTGTVQLSSVVYGHIKEAEMIVRNRCYMGTLKTLVENPAYQTLFARLVGLRIILSGVLTGLGNRRDRSFQRLHQEQHLLLRAFDKIGVPARRDWSRPVHIR
jgi:hypothetical protein